MTSTNLAQCPFPLHAMRPPYERFLSWNVSALPEAAEVPGFITVLEIPPSLPRGGEDLLEFWIPEVRRTVPRAPVIVHDPGPVTATRIHFATRALSSGARALCFDGQPPAESLRSQLTDSARFPMGVAEWLQLLHPRMPARTRIAVELLIRAGMEGSRLDDARLAARLSERTAQRWFPRAGLPSQSHFVRLGLLAPKLLDLQRRPGEHIDCILRDHGDVTTESLRKRCGRLLGTTPSAIRHTIGWEWWVASFLTWAD